MHEEISNEELLYPTVEYKLINEEKDNENEIEKEKNLIYIYYFFFVDISEISLRLNFGKYVNNI